MVLNDDPQETPLREKLYGDLAALKKTASFVRAAGVDIQKKRSRKQKNDDQTPEHVLQHTL